MLLFDLLLLGVAILVRFVNVVRFPLNFWNRFKRSECLIPIRDEILLCSAMDLAKKIRKKQLKSEQIVQSYIKRIQDINPLVNAVVQERFELALDEARAVDTLIEIGEMTEDELAMKKPLLGVPITIKESIAVKGMSNNAGCLRISHMRRPAQQDAVCVELVRNSGAIILATTNTPELCMNWETMNKITGYTCNPYNLHKTSGGSSGGEAALISAAASLIGVGSDIGGSLRIPAHYTGIFGHKPSAGSTDNGGHYPSSSDETWQRMLVSGPMARYAEDLPLLLGVLLKANLKDEMRLHEKVQIRNINFYYMTEDGSTFSSSRVNGQIKQAVKKAAAYFRNTYGIEVKKANLDLKSAIKMAFPSVLDIDLEIGESIFKNRGEGAFEELWKHWTCRGELMASTIIYGITKRTLGRTSFNKRVCQQAKQMIEVLKEEMNQILGTNGVLLYPTAPNTAFYHGDFFSKSLDITYCSIYNSLGLPATNCPITFDSNGMPIGIQVIANRYNDRLTLAVAKELETAFGGWHPPPSTEKNHMPN